MKSRILIRLTLMLAPLVAVADVSIPGRVVTLPPALSSIGNLTPSANKLPYYTGANTAAVADISPFALTLLGGANAAAMRTTLGVGAGDTPIFAGATINQTGGQSTLIMGDAAAGTFSRFIMRGGAGKYAFAIGVQDLSDNALTIAASTAAGGTTFSTPLLRLTDSGALFVAGQITSGAGLAKGNFRSADASGLNYYEFGRDNATTGDFVWTYGGGGPIMSLNSGGALSTSGPIVAHGNNRAATLKAATGTNSELYFAINDVDQIRIGTVGGTHDFRVRDEVNATEPIYYNGTAGTIALMSTSGVKGIRTAVATYDFGTVGAGSDAGTSVSVTGVAVGDSVLIQPADGSPFPLSLIPMATVEVANNAMARLRNPTGSGIVVGSRTFRVSVLSF